MEKQPFLLAIEQICEEKGLSKEKVLETIEMALAAAYKKDHGRKGQIVRAKFDPETGRAKFYQIKIVVDKSMLKPEEPVSEEKKKKSEESTDEEKKIKFNPDKHILLEEAQKIDPKLKPGDELVIPLPDYGDYGRIAAQTAKQVIIQRIREAERETIYEQSH